MIKVIKSGNTIKTFKCENCACVFKATERDYEIIETITCRKIYICTCPECYHTGYEKDE